MGSPGERRFWLGGAAVCSAVVIGACGSAHEPRGRAGAAIHSGALAFANCMRNHGVPNFPDPSGAGPGIDLAGTGINPQSPAFESARTACRKLSPGAAGAPRATEQQFLAALRFARCMRAHGSPTFPDPSRTDSPPGPILVIGSGLYFRVTQSFDPDTPAVKRELSQCGGGRGG